MNGITAVRKGDYNIREAKGFLAADLEIVSGFSGILTLCHLTQICVIVAHLENTTFTIMEGCKKIGTGGKEGLKLIGRFR